MRAEEDAPEAAEAAQSPVVRRALPSAVGYFWWRVRLHTLGVWRYGPLGYYRHCQAFERAVDRHLREHGG